MSTTSTGRQAEQKAAQYLKNNFGLNLISQNWRTRTCEIDLIMQKDSTVHFIEVKFRRNNYSGGGLASISMNKLQRMYQASLEWLENNPDYQSYSINIGAIELTGSKLLDKNIVYIESISYDQI